MVGKLMVSATTTALAPVGKFFRTAGQAKSKHKERSVEMRTALVAVSVLCCIGTAAHADILAGGPIYGGNTQTTAVCHVFNTGSTTAAFSLVGILGENGVGLPLTRNSCSPFLHAAESCSFAATISSNSAYSCQIVLANGTSKTDLRGSFDIRDGSSILINIELK
jgi:hypothetical protein